jgi:hypothetical protein
MTSIKFFTSLAIMLAMGIAPGAPVKAFELSGESPVQATVTSL